MNDVAVGLIALLFLLFFFLTGIELAFAMAIIGIFGYAYCLSPGAAFNVLAHDFFDTFASYGFTVVPLFLLMGQIAFHSGIAKRLYDAAYKLVGFIPGGLAMATVTAATLFKAMCGSTLATAATFASVAIPEMTRYGYSKKLSTGVVASVGTLGILIPPSVTMIIFGIITEQSIGKLFLAGIIPGLLIAFFFIVIIYVECKINPSMGPKGASFPFKEKIRALPEFLWVGAIFLVVVGGLMKGFFSPTEAGTIGTLAVLVLALATRQLTLNGFYKSIEESLRTACMVIMLIAASDVLGHFLAITEIPMMAADWIITLPLSRDFIMVLIMLVYLLGGSFIDDLAFMILATPIFYPAIIKLGYDPIWFGVLIGITVMIGVIIPPVAISVFVVKNITGEPFKVIYAGVYPFLCSLVFCALLLFLFPKIATFLPGL
jgi:tripartite ATP-independent transporter DctM subunit